MSCSWRLALPTYTLKQNGIASSRQWQKNEFGFYIFIHANWTVYFCFQRKQKIQPIMLDKNDTLCTHLG
nr:MAG TPA: hypothetical protein [Caudoviricetes sp.]